MNYVMGINLAVGHGGVGLFGDGARIGEIRIGAGKNASDHLLKAIDEALTSANLQIHDLSEVICVTGPGGYTGIRVSIATILGLQRASGFDVVGYSSFDVLSYDLEEGFSIIDAGRREYLVSRKSNGVKSAASIIKTGEISEFVSIQPGAINSAVADFGYLSGIFDKPDDHMRDCADEITDRLFGLHALSDTSLMRPLTPIYGREFGAKD